jgi:hypothetical protein
MMMKGDRSMKRYEGIMIVSDLDGTFLDDKGHVVPRNIDAIRAFCAEGGLFTFATGRHHDHLPEAVPGVKGLVNMPVIVANGSYLYDFSTERVLAEVFMDVNLSRPVLQFARANYPRVGFRVSTPQGYLTDGRTDYMKKFVDYSKSIARIWSRLHRLSSGCNGCGTSSFSRAHARSWMPFVLTLRQPLARMRLSTINPLLRCLKCRKRAAPKETC